jgi:putative hemolysin
VNVAAEPQFEARLARDAEELRAAQALRYEVFVAELGGDGPLVDHAARLERDAFDAHCDHLILIDHAGGGAVVGAYRLLPGDRAAAAGGFYSAGEYDLAPLLASGRRLLELGRSCLHADYRGGAAMFHLWTALAEYVQDRGIELLFGVASFHGTDPAALAQPLAFLHHFHLAPEALRPRSLAGQSHRMDLLPAGAVDRRAAVAAIPALIKGYLRLGGTVGEGAFVDHAFNTTDILLLMDTAAMNARLRDLYARRGPEGARRG